MSSSNCVSYSSSSASSVSNSRALDLRSLVGYNRHFNSLTYREAVVFDVVVSISYVWLVDLRFN